jgi:hypothetical protein
VAYDQTFTWEQDMHDKPSFNKYYKEIYLPLHQNKANRLLHLIGTVLTFAVAAYGLATLNWLPILLAPFLVYPFAWSGHLLLEKNKPAAWSSPIYARLSDWRMCIDLVRGKL